MSHIAVEQVGQPQSFIVLSQLLLGANLRLVFEAPRLHLKTSLHAALGLQLRRDGHAPQTMGHARSVKYQLGLAQEQFISVHQAMLGHSLPIGVTAIGRTGIPQVPVRTLPVNMGMELGHLPILQDQIVVLPAADGQTLVGQKKQAAARRTLEINPSAPLSGQRASATRTGPPHRRAIEIEHIPASQAAQGHNKTLFVAKN